MAPRRVATRHLVNRLLSISGFGSARVNHNAEFCILRFNQEAEAPLYRHTKHLTIHTTYTNISTTQTFFFYVQNRKYPSPVTSSVFSDGFYDWVHVHGDKFVTLQWRHNEPDNISNHRCLHCLLNRLFRRRSKNTSKLRVTGLC